jgi:hypothetical protein
MSTSISLKKYSNPNFIKYIESSSNICIYKFGNYNIPKNIFFPNVSTLTLINCNNIGINNILYPDKFPKLNTINYLSINTGNIPFHTRFNSNIKWIFPDKNYEYYNYMVKSGVGAKDPELIKKYVTAKKIIAGKNGFDISFELDLNIPNYGIVNGNWWCSQFYQYLNRHKLNNGTITQDNEEIELQKNIVSNEFNNLFEDIDTDNNKSK